ncbi:MAG: type II secretion system protein GspL [Gammaproteobacteria bacterium]|nr:type II secretion system protein GspL [Gammaproteobacteria bacterium]
MSEYLVLRLNDDQPNPASWVVADSSGRASLSESGSLAEAAQRAQQRPVIVLVPGHDVLLTKINLPVRGTARMQQAIPYALEDEIAENVNKMHFALGKRDSSGQLTVAYVRDKLLQDWLDKLDSVGLAVSHVVPDTVGIPAFDGVAIIIDGAQSLIRNAAGDVVVSETESLVAYVAAMGIDQQSEVPAELYVSEADASRYSQLLGELRIGVPDIRVHELRTDVLPVMAAATIQEPQPNLLQGRYARSSDRDKLWRPWRTAAILAGIFILTALGATSLEVMRLKNEMRTLNNEIGAIASEAMPGSRIVDPLLQLEQLAASLRGSGQGSDKDFLHMLDALSQALTVAGGSTLGRLDYRNGTMDLTLTAPDVDTLDKISREIEGKGLVAEIQSANQRDNAIQGRIRISGHQS